MTYSVTSPLTPPLHETFSTSLPKDSTFVWQAGSLNLN